MTLETEEYLKELEQIASCDLEKCDITLIESLKSMWETDTAETLANQDNQKVILKLFLQDMKEEVGPLRFECMSSWTGLTTKQKLFEFFGFPVKFQKLIVNSLLVDNQRTLKFYGIPKHTNKLTVFLIKKGVRDLNLINGVVAGTVDILGATNAVAGLMNPLAPTCSKFLPLAEPDTSSGSEYQSLDHE
uniref:uncharacterized protein LOC100179865 n=1 Tax=Ciona intestinalis TaxID=7719 RepID=UPI000180CD75|nr:uncharacterized protein LOC100179865 [Ciona intestinalis]|eukprot:XP_002128432.1 uncharacterized protein LOC100179865 [Ciona intestinalis]